MGVIIGCFLEDVGGLNIQQDLLCVETEQASLFQAAGSFITLPSIAHAVTWPGDHLNVEQKTSERIDRSLPAGFGCTRKPAGWK